MTHDVSGALEARDLLLLVVDCKKQVGLEDEQAVELLQRVKTPMLLVLNKVDLLKNKSRMLPLIEKYGKLANFEEFFPVSALTGDGLETLKQGIVSRMPEGPQYFPEDQITDQPSRFLAAEIVREKVLHLTRQEVPHSVMVQVEKWEQTEKRLKVSAAIVVEKVGQKAIIIGAKGARLKEIGTQARLELEQILGRKMYLELFVKVRKDWREKPVYLREIDWRN
jgi:GTP-binding protein Era